MDVQELTIEELEEQIAKKKAKKQKELEKTRHEYEKRKQELIDNHIDLAINQCTALLRFKEKATKDLNDFYQQLMEYGGVNKGNKGSFKIINKEGTKKVEYSRNVIFGYDEKGEIAAQKIRAWLSEKVKKLDKESHGFFLGLLEKSKDDGYDPRNIAKFYKYENEIKHPLFQEGVKLFKEAYKEQKTNFYIRYFETDSEGKWQPINLNWSSI